MSQNHSQTILFEKTANVDLVFGKRFNEQFFHSIVEYRVKRGKIIFNNQKNNQINRFN